MQTQALLHMRAIRELNEETGQHWFKPDTLRFFKSRVYSPVYTLPDGSALFVSSEKNEWNDPRLYTVRHATMDGNINSIGDFQAFDTLDKARRHARNFRAWINSGWIG